MVEWTEQERTIIANIFTNLNYEDVGPKALCRYDILPTYTAGIKSSELRIHHDPIPSPPPPPGV